MQAPKILEPLGSSSQSQATKDSPISKHKEREEIEVAMGNLAISTDSKPAKDLQSTSKSSNVATTSK